MTDDLSAGDDEKDDLVSKVVELHAAGIGRNRIAKILQITTWRVDVISRAENLHYDQERTRNAVEVRVAAAGEARRDLAERFRNIAKTALKQAELSSGDDGQPIFDADDVFRWVKVAGTAVDKDLAIAERLDMHQQDDSQDRAVEQLGVFGEMVRAMANTPGRMPNEPEDASPEDLGAPPLFNPADDREPDEPP